MIGRWVSRPLELLKHKRSVRLHIFDADRSSLVSRLRKSFYMSWLGGGRGGSLAKSFDLVENRIGCCGPDKRFAPLVVMRQVPLNGRLQGVHVLERTAPDPLGGDLGEEAFHLV